MISRDAFLERINQEGFSFSIDIPRRSFSDFTSLVRRRRISEEDLYQLFYNYCQELENDACSSISFQLAPFMINIKRNLIQWHPTDANSALSLYLAMTIV